MNRRPAEAFAQFNNIMEKRDRRGTKPMMGQQSFYAPLGARTILALSAKLATNHRAALQELWRGREFQNRLLVGIGLQCVRESNGWLPNPNLRSDEQAQVESTFAGGTSSLEVQPCSWVVIFEDYLMWLERVYQPFSRQFSPGIVGADFERRPEPGNEGSLLNP
jgi:hypothetical protein